MTENDIPPPRNEPKAIGTIRLDMTPEEFEPLRAQFMVDLGRLLGIPPDDVEVKVIPSYQHGQ